MKKYAVVFFLATVFLNLTVSFAQSRRVPPFSESSDKPNKRDSKPAESPTPAPIIEDVGNYKDRKPKTEI